MLSEYVVYVFFDIMFERLLFAYISAIKHVAGQRQMPRGLFNNKKKQLFDQLVRYFYDNNFCSNDNNDQLVNGVAWRCSPRENFSCFAALSNGQAYVV